MSKIIELQKQILSGEKTIEDVVQEYLATIEKRNKHLNALLEVYSDIHNQIEILRNRIKSGEELPLLGVVATIKDNICVKGKRVSAASKILENFISPYNATVIERAVQGGAILIGRANCDEFAMGSSNENSYYGPVRNPLDESCVPGGSSGGSAASVASKMCNISFGSDTGGSVRQPAAFCGVVGFKPSYGTFSRYGLIAFASSLDQIGIIAQNVEDVNLVYNVCAGKDPKDATSINVKFEDTTSEEIYIPKRVVFLRNCIEHKAVHENIKKTFYSLIDKLKNSGIEIEFVDFSLIDYVVPVYYIIACAQASSNLARYDGIKYGYRYPNANDIDELIIKTRSEGFGKEVKRRILTGTFVLSAGYYEAYYEKAQRVASLIRNEINSMFQKGDFIILPTSPSFPFKIGSIRDPVEMYMEDIFTVTANLCGIPAISLPKFTEEKKPVGIQIMAKYLQDIKLLKFARFVEEELRLEGVGAK